MARRYNLWSFYLCLFCLIISLHLVHSTVSQTWSIAPPVYIVWILTVASFILGVIGFGYNTNWLARVRSWSTVIVSILLSLALFLGVLSELIAEDLIKTSESPNNKYTINLYLVNGGATSSLLVKGILDGPLWFKKTIYNNNNADHADVEWIDNDTVSINNRVLNLKKGETFSD